MRRKDREITDLNEILEIVEKCPVMHLGVSAGNVPYVVPLNFAYELNGGQVTFFFHSAMQGRKVDMITKNPEVCFEMSRIIEVTGHTMPCSWTAEYESVIGYGKITALSDKEVKKKAMDAIMKKYGFDGVPQYNEKMLENTLISQITVTEITGKRNMK